MKKILFFVTAAAVTLSSFAPLAYAEPNRFGVEPETAVEVPIAVKTGLGSEMTSETLYGDAKEDTDTIKFAAKAEIDMTEVAQTWNTYVDAGVAAIKDSPLAGGSTSTAKLRAAVLANAKLSGAFTVTITAPSQVTFGISDETDSTKKYLTLDEDTAELFKLTNVAISEGKYEATFEIAADNTALDTFFGKSNKDKVLGITVNEPAVTGIGSYTVETAITGSVTVEAVGEKMTAKIDGEGEKNIKVNKIEVATALPTAKPIPTAKPTEEPTATPGPTAAPGEPTATPAPTAEPTAAPTATPAAVIPLDKVVDTSSDEDKKDTIYESYTKDKLSALQITVKKDNGDTATYGDDFIVKLTTKDNKDIVLDEAEYENIMNGHLDAVSDEVKEAIGELKQDETDGLGSLLGSISIEVTNPNSSLNIAPVYEVDGKYEIVSGLGTAGEDVKAEVLAPTPAPTKKPSHSDGGSSGGGGSVVAPKPTATPAPDATAAPTATPDPNATAAPADKTFTDVVADAWYNDAVSYVVEKGIMNGTSETTFEPSSNVTRAMAVTVLYRLEGAEAAEAVSFTDVEAGQWYTDAIAWASANGIVAGYEDGSFKPTANISRQDFALIMKRYADFKELTGTDTTDAEKFGDWSSVAGYAQDGVKSAVSLGLVKGDNNNNFNPTANITRAEMAVILQRLATTYSF